MCNSGQSGFDLGVPVVFELGRVSPWLMRVSPQREVRPNRFRPIRSGKKKGQHGRKRYSTTPAYPLSNLNLVDSVSQNPLLLGRFIISLVRFSSYGYRD